MVAATDRTGKQPQQGLPDHFNKLMDSPCTNHAYPIKHLYRDATSSNISYDRPVGQKKGTAKRRRPRKEAQRARTETVSPTPMNAS